MVSRGSEERDNRELLFNEYNISVMLDEQLVGSAIQYMPVLNNTTLYTSKFVKRVDHTLSVLTTNKTKRTQGNSWRYRIWLLPWLWWWYHKCLHMFKVIKLYQFNMCSSLYTTIKIKKKKLINSVWSKLQTSALWKTPLRQWKPGKAICKSYLTKYLHPEYLKDLLKLSNKKTT